MAEKAPHEMTYDEAVARLAALRRKEETGEITIHEAGEITKLLAIIREHDREVRRGEQAA